MKKNNSIFERFPVLKTIPPGRFPKHLLVIPDGNGRWAKKRKKFVLEGHRKGSKVMNTILRDISEIPEIKIITLWGFSADNWKRSEREVQGLFTIYKFLFEKHLSEMKLRNSRFLQLGRKDRISGYLLDTIEKIEEETKNNTDRIINIAIDFGGEDQELRLIEKVLKLPKDTNVSMELLWSLRDGNGLIPPADLMIRTSGEIRTSDIGWLNGAPTELYFIEKLFPDVTTSDIIDAIVEFSKRERRMGSRPK